MVLGLSRAPIVFDTTHRYYESHDSDAETPLPPRIKPPFKRPALCTIHDPGHAVQIIVPESQRSGSFRDGCL